MYRRVDLSTVKIKFKRWINPPYAKIIFFLIEIYVDLRVGGSTLVFRRQACGNVSA